MNYKVPGNEQSFLNREDIDETKNKIFFHFDSPSVIDKIDVIMII